MRDDIMRQLYLMINDDFVVKLIDVFDPTKNDSFVW